MDYNPDYGEDCRYGWGRFQRYDAWFKAELFLLDEHCDSLRNLETLLKYKAKCYAQEEGRGEF